ncbi:MAG: 16S rRNA (cytidine(1402)-2'-O)-methyltransferase [Clostridia bacterium]|nr:16S rRNA (cytidine(1402)-2'-O)-methyltransferase [Clostridia bacterium]
MELDKAITTEKNAVVPSTLYLVATPIGNMADLSPRAIKILSEVDFIAAEDTRNTQKLLNILEIHNQTISYYEHNKAQKGQIIIDRLKRGESCALVSDAGTPAISDPGEDIVKLCYENDIHVTSVPGCCAAITALTLSGLSTRRFAFEGFLPYPKKERKEKLNELKELTYTLILYEAPHKLLGTLSDLLEALSDRKIAICREITKLNEEIIRCTLSEAVTLYNDKSPRGEYVLIIEGKTSAKLDDEFSRLSIEQHVQLYIDQGMTKMDAIKKVAKERALPKNEVYSIICK